MSNKLVTIGGITAGIAIVTYVGLNLVAPFKQHDEKLQGGAKVEDVFSGDVASAPDIATPPDNQAPPKPAAEAPPAKDAPKDDAVAIEGASDFPMPAEPSNSGEPPAVQASAPEPAAAPEPAVAPVAAAALPRPTPDPVLDSEAVPAPAPAVTAAEAEPAAAPEPPAPAAPPEAVAAPVPAAAPKPAAVAKAAAQADALTQWWPQRSVPGRLNLLYAGQAANERSIGLLFDSTFAETADFGSGLKLIAANGRPATGSWEINSTRRMLLFKGLKPGRYTVIVSPQLANEAGLSVGSELHGPVYVR